VKDALKQRLVGAVILAAIAVIFLPSFFKEQQVYTIDTDTQIPDQPAVASTEFNAPEQVADIQPAPAPETMFQPPVVEQVPPEPDLHGQHANEAVHATPEAKTPEPATTDTGDESVPQLSLNADGVPSAWVVQVASLTNKAAANKLRDELQADGHKAYVRSIATANGTVTRVFIGPKLDKAEAQAVKAQIDERLKVKSLVRRFEP